MSEQASALIFNMALIIRRLLIKTDRRSAAARQAARLLEEADRMLRESAR